MIAVRVLGTKRSPTFNPFRCGLHMSSSASVTHTPALIAMTRYFEGSRDKPTLFVGEGDFGFSKCILTNLPDSAPIVCSTWDTAEKLRDSFLNASANVQGILDNGGDVHYQVDATKLEQFYPPGAFSKICWMFPHVPGKQNIKRNRLLLQSFFNSARKVLADDGIIILALAEAQSGCSNLASNQDWLHSWQLTAQAAEAGVLLVSKEEFDVETLEMYGYSPQGHRGSGGTFPTRRAEIFQLQDPRVRDIEAIQAPIYVHEVHLLSSKMHVAGDLVADATLAVEDILKQHGHAPALWSVLLVDFYVEPKSQLISHTLQIAYGSRYHAIGRTKADAMRAIIEVELPTKLNLKIRLEKTGGKVSKAHSDVIATALWKITHADQNLDVVDNSSALHLNQALRELEPGYVSNKALARAEENAAFTKEYHDKSFGEESESIRRIARKLWRRRVGVLVSEAGPGATKSP